MNINFAKLKTNAILICLHCGEAIQSHGRNDFKWCFCGAVAIDGGSDYCKVSSRTNARYIYAKSEKDLDVTLVGPRDAPEDPA